MPGGQGSCRWSRRVGLTGPPHPRDRRVSHSHRRESGDMGRLNRGRPAVFVAALALVAALAGTALAGPDATSSAINKKKVKKIATKQINELAPGLSVANASNADAVEREDRRTPLPRRRASRIARSARRASPRSRTPGATTGAASAPLRSTRIPRDSSTSRAPSPPRATPRWRSHCRRATVHLRTCRCRWALSSPVPWRGDDDDSGQRRGAPGLYPGRQWRLSPRYRRTGVGRRREHSRSERAAVGSGRLLGDAVERVA